MRYKKILLVSICGLSLLSYKIIAQGQLRAKLVLNQQQYWYALTIWLLGGIVGASILLFTIARLRKLSTANSQQQQALIILQQQNKDLMQQINDCQLATVTQQTYGILAMANHTREQLIKLQQLLQDVLVVNVEYAANKNAQLKLIAIDANFACYGNKLRLMQILSGMLYEIIHELSVAALIEIQLVLSNVAPGLQKICFKFVDNGFYSQLLDREEMNSNADVRVKGWQNIRYLIELEEGVLEHTHVIYQGNTLTLSIIRKVVNNVVVLEQLTR